MVCTRLRRRWLAGPLPRPSLPRESASSPTIALLCHSMTPPPRTLSHFCCALLLFCPHFPCLPRQDMPLPSVAGNPPPPRPPYGSLSPLRGGGGGGSTSSIRQLLGAADAQTAHHATFSTAPSHQLLGSANAETTPAGAPAAAADRKQRPDATCEGKNG